VLTSALHLFNFGMEFAGVGMLESIASCVVVELTFIASEQFCLREMKSREQDKVFDKFDLGAWALLAVIAMAYMVLVNKVYGTMAEAMTLYPTDAAAGLKAAHAATNTGLLAFGKGLYAVSAPVFGGLLIALKIVTTLVSVNSRRAEAGLDQGDDRHRIINPRRMALNKNTPPVPKLKSGRKRSETGEDYDATAEITIPEDGDGADDDREALQQNETDMHDLRKKPRTADKRQCVECGKGFASERADAKYCTEACRKRASRRRAREETGA
jgi:hypothetical protein